MGNKWLHMQISAQAACIFLLCWLLVDNMLQRFFPHFRREWQSLGLFLSIALGAVLGFGFAASSLDQRLTQIEHTSQAREIVVYAGKLNEWGEQSIQQKVTVLNLNQTDPQQNRSYLAFIPQTLIQAGQPALELGHYYRLNGFIKPAHGYAAAGVFDQEKWYVQQGLHSGFKVKQIEALNMQQVEAMGYAHAVRQNKRWTHRLALWIEQQRLNLRLFIVHQPIRNKGLILALLTGDESLLDQTVKEFFQRFGISHLLAISGPHVLIFAGMVCWLMQRAVSVFYPKLYLFLPRQYWLIFPFLICAVLYSLFAGFEVPALRTVLMCLLASIFILLKQKIQPLKLLMLSASVLLLLDPFSILSAAFWLSYGACFILLRIYQTLQREQCQLEQQTHALKKLLLTLRLLALSQWKIFVALSPLMILFFKQLAWIAPLSNLIAIPWLSCVVVPLDILAALCYAAAPALSSLLFQLNDLLLSGLLAVLQGIDSLFHPAMQPAALNGWMLCLLVLGLLILFLPPGLMPKSWSVAAFLPLLMPGIYPQKFELHIIDVGQGQAILIREGRHSMMVDMGGNYDEQKFSVGKQVIQPFLAVHALRGLDQLVLTHLDQDHSGAYYSLQSILPIQHLYSSEKPQNVPVQTSFEPCVQGQRWQWSEQVSIEVLSPRAEQLQAAGRSKNENSCVLLVHVAQAMPYSSFLLMGDAGWETEFQLMQDYPQLQADVLVLGHHGSRNSSAYYFLQAVQPKLAVASAGKENRYGHPAPITQARLQQLHIPLLTTIAEGSIRFKLDKTQMMISFARDDQMWQRPACGYLESAAEASVNCESVLASNTAAACRARMDCVSFSASAMLK